MIELVVMEDILNRWIPERLQTWSFPNRSEQDFIADTVPMIESTIVDTAAQISDTERKLEELKRQQELLKLRLAGCRSLLSPIRKLPEEILLDIFRLSSNFQTVLTIQGHWEDDRAPVSWARSGSSLSAVCSAWNTLIVNTASFWSRISVELICWEQTTPSLESFDMIQKSLSIVLERSKGAPLDVAISVRHMWSLASTVTRPLFQEAHRWKSLHLELFAQQYTDHGFHVFENGLGTLEMLSVTATDGSRLDGMSIGHSKWFSSVPRLHDLTYVDIPSGLLDMPWSQLQKLVVNNFCDPHPALYIQGLKSATQLHSLDIRIWEPPDMTSHVSIPLPSVKSLNTSTIEMRFLGVFTFLNLTDLVVDVLDKGMPAFLSQVSRTLQRLSFTDNGPGELFPVTFFKSNLCFPELTELSVTTNCSRGTQEAETCVTSSVRDRFPKLLTFSCRLKFSYAVDNSWRAAFTWLSQSPTTTPSDLPGSTSTRKIETLVVIETFILSDNTPILRDVASKVAKFTVMHEKREMQLEDHLEEVERKRQLSFAGRQSVGLFGSAFSGAFGSAFAVGRQSFNST